MLTAQDLPKATSWCAGVASISAFEDCKTRKPWLLPSVPAPAVNAICSEMHNARGIILKLRAPFFVRD